MLVVQPDRLHEAHRGEAAFLQCREEVALVLEMGSAPRRVVSVIGVVRKGLVMVLEPGMWVTRQGVVPAPRVPGPVDPGLAQPVAYRRRCLAGDQQLGPGGSGAR